MAGRGRLSASHILQLRDSHHPLLRPAPPPQVAHLVEGHPMVRLIPVLPGSHPSIIAAEERLAAQHREIQVLLADNQHLAATHVALKQEVDASRHELRHATAMAAKVRAERDAEVRDVLDRSVKAEADARAVEGMRAELSQVRADVQMFGATRNDLLERLQGLKSELARAREDLGQASAIQAEIEAMNREIQRGRAAVEYEKKARAENLQQRQEMERNMISMAREVEKLRAELANAEKRARASAAAAAAANPGPGYADVYRNAGVSYGGSAYNAAYNLQQVQLGADVASQYTQVAASHVGYDIQQTHIN